MCGTNPAFQILKTWIEERKLEGEDASGVLATMPAHLQTPSPDIVRQFYVSISAASIGHTHRQHRHQLHCLVQKHKARQAMYVQRNIEVLSCNHCCSGNAISITYSECVLLALGIQHVMRMRYIIICGLPGCTMFLHIIS